MLRSIARSARLCLVLVDVDVFKASIVFTNAKGDAKEKKKTTWISLGFELRAAFLRSFLLNI